MTSPYSINVLGSLSTRIGIAGTLFSLGTTTLSGSQTCGKGKMKLTTDVGVQKVNASDEARRIRAWLKEHPGFVGGYHGQDSQTGRMVSITGCGTGEYGGAQG
jgi:hypothetical protein